MSENRLLLTELVPLLNKCCPLKLSRCMSTYFAQNTLTSLPVLAEILQTNILKHHPDFIHSRIMPKVTKKKKQRFLKCQDCHQFFAVGRSYSNHVSRCPARSLLLAESSFAVMTSSLPTQPKDAPLFASLPTKDSASSVAEDDDDNIPFPDDPSDNESTTSRTQSTISENAHIENPIVPTTNILSPPTDATITKKSLFPSFHCYTSSDIIHLQLMNICQSIRAPVYAYDALMNWAQNAKLSGYDFPSNAPSRKTFLDNLYSRFNMKAAKPKETTVPLHPDLTATVVTFSFDAMARSLLEDETLMAPENLLINNLTPDDLLDDINSGEWYKAATIRLCINEEDVLCPIILFIDATHVDKLSKWSLEPVLFTLGIFNRKTRNLSTAWRPLGLVTNTIRMSSATRAEFGKKVRTDSLA
jgi:hypothetical protein